MNETRQTRWTSAFADATDAVFTAIAAPEIALAGSAFERPAGGVDSVWDDVANIERPLRLPRNHRQKFFEGIPEGLVDRWRALTLVCVAFFKREDRAVSEPPWRTELRSGASALRRARAPRAGCRADHRGRLALRPDRHDGLLRALITSSTG